MNYITSEIYRLKKTPIYKIFLIISLLIIIGTMILIIVSSQGNTADFAVEYLDVMTGLAMFAILVVDGVGLTIVYKTKDTKIQILTYGIERTKMYLLDYLSYMIYIIITVFILYIISIISGIILSNIITIGLGNIKEYTKSIIELIIININLATGMFGVAYLLNSVTQGIFSQIILIPFALNILSLIIEISNEKIAELLKALNSLQPINIINTIGTTSDTDEKIIILKGFITVLIMYFIPGLIAYKKREIY